MKIRKDIVIGEILDKENCSAHIAFYIEDTIEKYNYQINDVEDFLKAVDNNLKEIQDYLTYDYYRDDCELLNDYKSEMLDFGCGKYDDKRLKQFEKLLLTISDQGPTRSKI